MLQLLIVSAVHTTHAPCTNLLDDVIAPKGLADELGRAATIRNVRLGLDWGQYYARDLWSRSQSEKEKRSTIRCFAYNTSGATGESVKHCRLRERKR